MGENSHIEWTDHTFNPWIGCTKVSAACDHCYAEVWDHRFAGGRWGPRAPRTRTKSWRGPVKWDREAAAAGTRRRVFCASLADVFDNHRSIDPTWRNGLWDLIRRTPNLDWLLLTKRPQNIPRFLPHDWGAGLDNVWLGATVEDQTEYDRRVHHLTAVPARVRFLSMEPLLGPVDLRGAAGLHWIIAGGESGPGARPMHPDWARGLRDQCQAADVPFHFKQWGAWLHQDGDPDGEFDWADADDRGLVHIWPEYSASIMVGKEVAGRALDGRTHDGRPKPNDLENA